MKIISISEGNNKENKENANKHFDLRSCIVVAKNVLIIL